MKVFKQFIYSMLGLCFGLTLMGINIPVIFYFLDLSKNILLENLLILFYLCGISFASILFLVIRVLFSETLLESQKEINELKEDLRKEIALYSKWKDELIKEITLKNNV